MVVALNLAFVTVNLCDVYWGIIFWDLGEMAYHV
jgi:hypothetical protein